jgi:hypothetical protein
MVHLHDIGGLGLLDAHVRHDAGVDNGFGPVPVPSRHVG